jgi:hypothetical protein
VFDLNGAGFNSGDAADAYPGTAAIRPSRPRPRPTATTISIADQIEVTEHVPPGHHERHDARGDPGPPRRALRPNAIDNDQTAVLVTVSGSRIRYGATFISTRAQLATASHSGPA